MASEALSSFATLGHRALLRPVRRSVRADPAVGTCPGAGSMAPGQATEVVIQAENAASAAHVCPMQKTVNLGEMPPKHDALLVALGGGGVKELEWILYWPVLAENVPCS